jgi:lipoic acid synthetase
LAPEIVTKSGIMVGLGEKFDEVVDVMRDLRNSGCEIITIGQYLRPSKKHLPVERFVYPEVFDQYKKIGDTLGFNHIASAPFVRSSFNAEQLCANSQE